MTYEIRLRAYTPGTDTPLGLLPETLSWDASVVHNNDGALTLKVSRLADGGELLARSLNDGLDVALEVNLTGAPDGWTEPDGCRFLMVDRSYDPTDTARVYDLTLPSWSWLLNKICDLNTGALQGSKSKYAGQRLFAATSDAGDVVKKGLDEHDARSGPAVPIVRSSWTTTTDSLGHAWAKTLGKNAEGRAFPAGQPLHARLDALTTNGLCDWRTRGRGLRIYNPNTAFTDRSATVHLRFGDDLADAPSKQSQADRIARLLVKGDGKHKVTTTDPTIPEHYGRWEGMLDSAGVKDDDDLEDAGKAELATRNRIKGEYTRTLTMAGQYLPFRDYQVGDWITAPGSDGDEVLRVMQITISRASDGKLGGNIVLGDRFTAKDLAMASRVSAITGGTSGVSGNGSTTQPEPPDTRQAATPTGFTVTPSLVLADRRWRVRVDLSWDAVTLATDGTALAVSGYRVWGQPAGGEWRQITTTAATSVALMDYAQGSVWTFGVSAVPESAQWESATASSSTITLPTDTAAPAKTSAPHLESASSIVTASWDGLSAIAGPMDPDLSVVRVLADTVNPPATVVGVLGAEGTWTGYATAGTTVYFALQAVDTSGNEGPVSDVVSIVVKSVLDDADLADLLALKATVYVQDTDPVDPPPGSWWWTQSAPLKLSYTDDGETWVTRQVDADQFIAAGTIVTQLLAAAAVQADNIASDAILARHIRAGEVTADKIGTGLMQAQITLSGIIRTAETGKRVVLDSTGITLYDAADVPIVFINTDGESFFQGDAYIKNAEIDQMQINEQVEMQVGSEMVLAAGITAPGTPPNVTNLWVSPVTLLNGSGGPIAPVSVNRAADGTWWALDSALVLTHHDATTGALIDSHRLREVPGTGAPGFDPSQVGRGVVVAGTDTLGLAYLVEGEGTGLNVLTFELRADSLDGMQIGRDPISGGTWYLAGSASLCDDGGDLLVGYKSISSDKEVFRRVAQSLGAWVIAATVSNATSNPADLASPRGVAVGDFDLGAKHYLYGNDGYFRVTRNSDQVNVPNAQFAAVNASTVGVGYHSGEFWSADASGKIYRHDGPSWTDAPHTKTHDFGFTYYDSNTTGGTHESALSAKRAVAIKKRARVRVSVTGWTPDTSGDDTIDQLRYYAAITGGTLHLQGASGTGYIDVTSILNSGPTPPAVSDFPGSVPAVIRNSDGTLEIKADGTVKFKRGHYGRVTRATDFTLTNASTYYRVLYSATDATGDAFIDHTTGICTIPETGLWRIGAGHTHGNPSASRRVISLVEVGTGAAGSNTEILRLADETSAGRVAVNGAVDIWLTAGDQVSVAVWSAATSNRVLRSVDGPIYLSATRIR